MDTPDLTIRTLGSAQFHVYELGDRAAPSAIYLHGEAATRPDPLANVLAETMRVTCPVIPGYGDAPRPRWVATVRDVADLLLDLVDELKARPLLVGTSLGAWVATEVALAAPDRFTALVLISPVGLYVPQAPPADHWFATTDQRNAMLYSDLGKAPEVSFAEFVANDEATARLAWNPRFADPTLRHRLRRLGLETLIVWASSDRLIPQAQAEEWDNLITTSRLALVEESGHFPNYEIPEVVAALISDFAGALVGSSS
ncbi:MAG: alpha/beta hydrolase [Actinobacteria bacterium]|nr:alpha/beta hydrolase [Actinomycetota bacterium]MCI0678262.1 alpha/beta hydrolase [Actinomycetota bacterium]